MTGSELFARLKPFAEEWLKSNPERSVKINVVFGGKQDNERVLEVIAAARSIHADVGVIELGGSRDPHLRSDFEAFRTHVATLYDLEERCVELLDQVHLFNRKGYDPIRFYQDHCKDAAMDTDGQRRGCKACRNIHLRIGPTENGLGAVPCPFEDPMHVIPILENGHIIDGNFEAALLYNGRGPHWAAGTKYEKS
jgi:hypothetical protein